MTATELVAKLGEKARAEPLWAWNEAREAYTALAVNTLPLVLKALEEFLDSKTALRIACPTCTITLLEKGERQHEEDCPAWLAQEALATVADAAKEALGPPCRCERLIAQISAKEWAARVPCGPNCDAEGGT